MHGRVVAIGADGARGGWIAAVCFAPHVDSRPSERRTEVALCRTFDAVAQLRRGSGAVVAVDVPIGLLEAVDLRPCDREARELLGPRRSTVFAPPSRPLLQAATYADARQVVANARVTQPAAKGLSAQAFGLTPKIREVDGWVRQCPEAQTWLYECHPELSFRALAGGRVLDAKTTPQGRAQRRELVVDKFPDARDVIGRTKLRAGDADVIDILDAYAALASALRVARGDHQVLGGEPDASGLAMRIVV
jgi:predicted RNase H-like nuclease